MSEAPVWNEPAEAVAPQLVALLLCDWANVTEDGKTNLTGIFDRVFVPKLPHNSPPFFLYTRLLHARPGKIDLVISGPSGDELGRYTAVAGEDWAEDEAKLGNVLGRITFEAERAGTHWVSAYYEGQLLGKTPLTVEVSLGQKGAG